MIDKEELIKVFAGTIQALLRQVPLEFTLLQEIRLRADSPFILTYDGQELFVTSEGKISQSIEEAYRISRREITETMEYIGNYSLYAFEDEVRQGFITIQGGHRVGIAGKTILDGDKVRSIKHISFINVRISHEIKGCAGKVLPYIKTTNSIYHTLIVSPPRCGKTTLLRDIIRQISNGTSEWKGSTVGVVDERSEIGGCYMGVPQNDLGMRTDILDCCPKAEGMMMMLRSMAPTVICVDEIGDYRDIHAIESVIHCGCKLIASVHGSSIEDAAKRPLLEKLVQEHVFERYIILDGREKIGTVKQIFDHRGTILFEKKELIRC
jgi:stage III sporulation protein AA